jgi:hypothetical protein
MNWQLRLLCKKNYLLMRFMNPRRILCYKKRRLENLNAFFAFV